MKYFLVLFALMFVSIGLAEPYAEYWFTSGDSFDLDGVFYTVYVSTSSDNVLVRSDDGSDPRILSVGRCIETLRWSACYSSYSGSSDDPQAQFLIYEKNLDVSVEVSATEAFVSETIELEITLKNQEIETQNVSFFGVLPNTMSVVSATGCTYTEGDTLTVVFAPGDMSKNSERKCTLRVQASQAQEYFFVGELRYSFEGESSVHFSTPEKILFKRPYTLGKHVPANVTPLETFELNLSVTNILSRRYTFDNLTFQIPSHFTLRNERMFSSCTEKGQFLECYASFSLSSDETRVFSLELRSRRDSEQALFIRPKYTISSQQYRDDLIRVPVSLKDVGVEEPPGCFDKENVEISTTLDFNRTHYSGSALSFRLFVNNTGNDNITEVTSTIQEDDLLVDKTHIPLIRPGNTHYLSNIFLRLPVVEDETEIVYVISTEYLCPDGSSHVEFSDFSFDVAPIKDIVLEKEISSESIQSGDDVSVTVLIESENNISLPDVRIREVLPSGFTYRGTTSATLQLSSSSETTAYTYVFTAPFVSESSTFDLGTFVEFEIDGTPYSIQYDFPVNVSPRVIGDVDVDILVDKEQLYQYEPAEIRLRFRNNESDPITNLSISVPSGSDYHVEYNDFFFPIIYPGQTIDHTFHLVSTVRNLSVQSTASFLNAQGALITAPVDFQLSFERARYDYAVPEFTLDIFRQGEDASRITASIINRYPTPITITFFNTSMRIEEYSEREEDLDLPFFDLGRFTDGFYTKYSLFDMEFMILPKSYTVSEQISEVPPTQDIPQQVPEEEDESADLDDGVFFEDDSEDVQYALLAMLLLLIFAGGFGSLFFLRIRRKNASLKKSDAVLPVKTPVVEHTMKESVPEVKDLKPTNIFSFNEYEKFRESLDKK